MPFYSQNDNVRQNFVTNANDEMDYSTDNVKKENKTDDSRGRKNILIEICMSINSKFNYDWISNRFF